MDASEHPAGTCGLCESLNKLYLWWLLATLQDLFSHVFYRLHRLVSFTAAPRADCAHDSNNKEIFSQDGWVNLPQKKMAIDFPSKSEWTEMLFSMNGLSVINKSNVLHSKPVVSSKSTVYFPGIVAHYASKLNKEINTNILLVIYIIKEHNHFTSKIQNTDFVVYIFLWMNEWCIYIAASGQ